jgi:hypothetical protein
MFPHERQAYPFRIHRTVAELDFAAPCSEGARLANPLTGARANDDPNNVHEERS